MENHASTAAVDRVATTSIETHSAVSWGAVSAGAVAALALSFVLVSLAGGFGLKLISPWPAAPGDLADFTPMLGATMIVVQVLSSALGGYLAGRLRSKWTNVHSHELHFRDTAHGLLSWALSVLIGVVLAATVLAPLAYRAAAPIVGLMAVRDDAAAHFSLFMGIGLLLGAFTASVAAAIGGLRREEMHAFFWTEHTRLGRAE